MRSLLVSAMLLTALAGCSDPPAEPRDAPAASLSGSTTGGPQPPAQPTVEVLPFSFDGNLGTYAHGCIFPVGQCTDGAGTVVEGETDLLIERPGTNLTGLSFNLTWTAGSPATQDLWVGAMVMTSCDACVDTSFQDAHGTSPVRVDVRDVSVALSADAVVHIYVYNPNSFVYDPAVPAYGVASADQEFHIEGIATFLVPPA